MTLATFSIFLTTFIASVVMYGIYNGRADAIKDYRTHLGDERGGHPYRSAWHLYNMVGKVGLFLGGCSFMGLIHCFYEISDTVIITFAVVWVILSLYLSWEFWEYNYRGQGEVWYKVDETMKLKTGIYWIDYFLGFHHSPE